MKKQKWPSDSRYLNIKPFQSKGQVITDTVGCNYLSLSLIPTIGTPVLLVNKTRVGVSMMRKYPKFDGLMQKK